MRAPGSGSARGKTLRITWTACGSCGKRWPDPSQPCPWCGTHDATGRKRTSKVRTLDTNTAKKDLEREWVRQLKETGTIVERVQPPPKTSERTFGDLADHYEERYAIPPVYEGEKKVAGMKGWKTARGQIAHLRRELGAQALASLSWTELDDARARLRVGMLTLSQGRGASRKMVETNRQRKLATVNRIMARCKRMLKVARQRQWMTHNPFELGDALVVPSLETERDRVATPAEESALLAAVGTGKRRGHMRAAIIVAIETGMREWELLHMQKRAGVLDPDGVELPWIDWTARVVRIRGKHTKNAQPRIVPLTLRAFDALREFTREQSLSHPAVFGIDSISTSWRRARKVAGCPDLRYHDLRHTAATRMIQRGVPVELVAKILGQKDTQTTRRYVNVDEKIAQEIAGILDAAVMVEEQKAPEGQEQVN